MTIADDWEKLNGFQYRHKKQKDCFWENRNGSWIFYDKSNLDIVIPLEAFTNNPVGTPQDLSFGTYNEFLNKFETGLLN